MHFAGMAQCPWCARQVAWLTRFLMWILKKSGQQQQVRKVVAAFLSILSGTQLRNQYGDATNPYKLVAIVTI